MPTYDFRCNKCEKEFTLVITVKAYEQRDFTCQHCQSKDVERLVEAFQVVTSRKG